MVNDLGLNVADNPYTKQQNSFPFLIFKLSNIKKDSFQQNFTYQYTFIVDIFSNYDGEKEILEIEEKIFDALPALYEVPGVTYIRQHSCKILDDGAVGSRRKHGVITYYIFCNGTSQEG